MISNDVHAFRYATKMWHDSEIFYRFAVYKETGNERPIDYWFWIIRGCSRIVLVDTGCSPSAAVSWQLCDYAEPVSLLAELGIGPDDVTDVILTHLHYDHAGDVRSYPNAMFHISQRETDLWTSNFATHKQSLAVSRPEDIAEVVTLGIEGRLSFTADLKEITPGVSIVNLPGHSPGQIGVAVETAKGPLLIASDAAHYLDEIRLDRPFCLFTDLPEMLTSYARMRSIAEGDLARVIPGHDPLVRGLGISPTASDRVIRLALELAAGVIPVLSWRG
jgi:glyoxylase-like metal-dependent hydrolase (beta-lactamase superfamily II)